MRMGLTKRRLISAGAFLVTVGVLGVGSRSSRTVSRAQVAFDKLRELRGNWEGKDDHGMAVKTNFKVMVSDTMVMETLAAIREVTLIYPPARGKGGTPRVLKKLTRMDQTQQQLFELFGLDAFSPREGTTAKWHGI